MQMHPCSFRARSRAGKAAVSLILAGAALALCSCRPAIELASSRPKAAPGSTEMLDGQGKPVTPFQLENGLVAGFWNDNENLYILFSPGWQFKRQPHILAEMTLWLKESSEGSRRIGLAYEASYFPAGAGGDGPGGDAKPPELIPVPETAPILKDSALQKRLYDARLRIRVIQDGGRGEAIIPANGSSGPEVAFSAAWGDYTYRWRVPLQGAGGGPFSFRAQPGQKIEVGMTWKPKRLYNPRKFLAKEERKTLGRRPPPFGSDGMPPGEFRSDDYPRRRSVRFRITLAKAE